MTTTSNSQMTAQHPASSSSNPTINQLQTPIKPINLQSSLASPSHNLNHNHNPNLHQHQQPAKIQINQIKTKSINPKVNGNSAGGTSHINNSHFKQNPHQPTPSPIKAQIPIAARPLAPATSQPSQAPIAVSQLPLQVKTVQHGAANPAKKASKQQQQQQQQDNLLIQQQKLLQQQQQRAILVNQQPQQINQQTLTPEQFAQLTAVLKQQQSGSGNVNFINPSAVSNPNLNPQQFFQFIPITGGQQQPQQICNRVAQTGHHTQLILAPVQNTKSANPNPSNPATIASSATSSSSTCPKPIQQQQPTLFATTPDGQISQIIFQTVQNTNQTPSTNISCNNTANQADQIQQQQFLQQNFINFLNQQQQQQQQQHQQIKPNSALPAPQQQQQIFLNQNAVSSETTSSSASASNLQLLHQRLAEEEQRQNKLLKQLKEKSKQSNPSVTNGQSTKHKSPSPKVNMSPKQQKQIISPKVTPNNSILTSNENSKIKSSPSTRKCVSSDEEKNSCSMEIDAENTNTNTNTTITSQQNQSCSSSNKRRGRPRLYEINPSTGKSIKGRLLPSTATCSLNTQKSKPKPQTPSLPIQLTNGIAIYPSPSTSTSSHTSNQAQSMTTFFINANQTALANNNSQSISQIQSQTVDEHDTENENENENDEMEADFEEDEEIDPPDELEKEKPVLNTSLLNTSSKSNETQKPIINRLSPNSMKSQVVLTHVIDGYIIKESSKPFPVKPNRAQSPTQAQAAENTSISMSNTTVTNSPPKSTSTPSNLNTNNTQQKSCSKKSKKSHPDEDELTDKLNNSKLLEETTNSLNTSNTSSKSNKEKSKCHKHHHRHHHRHQCSSSTSLTSSPKKSKIVNKQIDDNNQNFRLTSFITNSEQMDTNSPSLSLAPPLPPLINFSPTAIQFNSPLNTNLVMGEQYPSGDPTEWNCDDVYRFVRQVAGQVVAEMFKSQEVDGSALNLIRDDHLVNTMQIKLGPALKIMSKFNELKTKWNGQQSTG